MKTLLTTLSIFTLTTSSITFSSGFNTTSHNSNIITKNQEKTQQDTIYIDNKGNQITTTQRNLTNIDTKEIIQIGFFQNQKGEIQVVRMPKTIEKVPTKLPAAITSLKNMFLAASKFNQDISGWDVSHITNMKLMFLGAIAFNQDLSTWDVSHVTNMAGMFDLTLFNQNIGNWNTAKVTNMLGMFFYNSAFNQDISQWNVGHVTNMSYMFLTAKAFNQDISQWNVANVINMDSMFEEATSFNQDLSHWNVNKVIDYDDFDTDAGFDSPSKLPHFKS